jgi:isoleucyl-tRNA synthetase
VRDEINRQLDIAKKNKIVSSSQESKAILGVYVEPQTIFGLEKISFIEDLHKYAEEIKTVAQLEHLEIIEGYAGNGHVGQILPWLSVAISKAPGAKCLRCWFHRPGVGENAKHPHICHRCLQVLEG